jgi:hypothetical protein
MMSFIDQIVVSETSPLVKVMFKTTNNPTSKLTEVVGSLSDYCKTQGIEMSRSPQITSTGENRYQIGGKNSRDNIKIVRNARSITDKLESMDFPVTDTARFQENYLIYFNLPDGQGFASGYVSHISPIGSTHQTYFQDGNDYTRY